jgi:hypothetical protein
MTYPGTVQLEVKVNGIDITDNVWLQDPGEAMQIVNVLTRQIDTCSFTVGNYGSLTAFKEWDELIVRDVATSTRLFAGFIQTINKKLSKTGNRLDAKVTAGDYAAWLDHVLVKQQFLVSTTDAAMLAYIFNLYAPEFDATTNVAALKTYPRIRFNRMTLRQIIDQLADAAGGNWYIDYNKKLHFFALDETLTPFNLSDAPNLTTTYPYEKMVKNDDGTGVVNRVEVVGGDYLSDDVTLFIAGTGQEPRVILPFKMSGPAAGGALQVWRNDGTLGTPVFTSLTVKVGYIDTLTGANQVLTYFVEKVLEQQAVWPNLANAVKVFGRYNIPLLTRYTDGPSYAYYGRYFDAAIVDASIVDKTTAKQRAQGLMAKAALASVALSCVIRQPGLRSGMTVHAKNTSLGIDDDFFLQRVTGSISQGGYATYTLDFGVYRPDLVDIIIAIARNAKTVPEWRDDEVLNELLQFNESTTHNEQAGAPFATFPPYDWTPTGGQGLTWDFGTWS